ncbi:MAG: 30S ribosome-binding factor RbfA [Verrucomicrobiaceae bacterium]|jgi:ribosome-binding factor A|nr:30S ribosome-binding factor RbfA [Verrucomicrobiaceae bacterium]
MSQRLDRINELLRREISTVLQRDFEFGGALVTVSGVDITQDLREAKVFVGVLGGYGAKVIEQLSQRRALIQSRVAKRVVLRCTPKLDFRLDTSAARGVDMINVLDEVDKIPKAPPAPAEDEEA